MRNRVKRLRLLIVGLFSYPTIVVFIVKLFFDSRGRARKGFSPFFLGEGGGLWEKVLGGSLEIF